MQEENPFKQGSGGESSQADAKGPQAPKAQDPKQPEAKQPEAKEPKAVEMVEVVATMELFHDLRRVDAGTVFKMPKHMVKPKSPSIKIYVKEK